MTHPEMRAALAYLGLDIPRDFGVGIAQRLVWALPAKSSPSVPARRPQPQGTTRAPHSAD